MRFLGKDGFRLVIESIRNCFKEASVPVSISLALSVLIFACGFFMPKEICLFLLAASFIVGLFGHIIKAKKGQRLSALFMSIFYGVLFVFSAFFSLIGLGTACTLILILFFFLEAAAGFKAVPGFAMAAALYAGTTAGFGVVSDQSFFCLLLMFMLLFGLPGSKKGRVVLFVFVMLLLGILRISNKLYFGYRWAYLGWRDIASFGTFLDVAGTYRSIVKLDEVIAWLIASFVSLTVTGVLSGIFSHPSFKASGKTPAGAYKFFALRLVSILGLFLMSGAFSLYHHYKSDKTILDTEMIQASLIQDIRFNLMPVDGQRYRDVFSEFSSDEVKEGLPHIIIILGESMGDTKKSFGVSYDTDPLEPLFELEKEGAVIGEAAVNVFGGGTSVSEWEVLTGLSSEKSGIIGSPFINLKKSPSFVCDPVYDGYRKVFLHTGDPASWERDAAYLRFGFSERYFADDIGKAADSVSAFRSDRDLYSFVTKLTSESEEPLFIKAVTLECHGLYNYLPIGGVTVHEASGLEDAETFATIEKDAATAFYELVEHYSSKQDEKVLIIFYADHNPSLGAEKLDIYHTPYLVWSNFCDLEDMPKEMPLGKLLPSAKKAAGLPLGAWEKYVLSVLDVPDEEITAARIRLGAVENGDAAP